MQARTSGTALARLVWLALGLTAGAGRLLFCSCKATYTNTRTQKKQFLVDVDVTRHEKKYDVKDTA